ncbi:hypothetical protein VTN49DRAFT_3483 [Thermomyces lanuginosus]|uniref:uncharacterized protein n=1 Tax=Thermomyces lanuginosus TaxID=5541 RepID=UPI003742DE45
MTPSAKHKAYEEVYTLIEDVMGALELIPAAYSGKAPGAMQEILQEVSADAKGWQNYIKYDTDLISSLPFDIVLQIVKQLGPANIVRCQKVSKRWRTLFKSKAIIKSALDQTLDFQDVDGQTKDAMTYFQWQHRLESARPIRKVFLPWPDGPSLDGHSPWAP